MKMSKKIVKEEELLNCKKMVAWAKHEPSPMVIFEPVRKKMGNCRREKLF